MLPLRAFLGVTFATPACRSSPTPRSSRPRRPCRSPRSCSSPPPTARSAGSSAPSRTSRRRSQSSRAASWAWARPRSSACGARPAAAAGLFLPCSWSRSAGTPTRTTTGLTCVPHRHPHAVPPGPPVPGAPPAQRDRQHPDRRNQAPRPGRPPPPAGSPPPPTRWRQPTRRTPISPMTGSGGRPSSSSAGRADQCRADQLGRASRICGPPLPSTRLVVARR